MKIKNTRGTLRVLLVAAVSALIMLGSLTIGFAGKVVHVPGTVDVNIVGADLLDAKGIIGGAESCSASVSDDNSINFHGQFGNPGAYSTFLITVRNDGSLPATLASTTINTSTSNGNAPQSSSYYYNVPATPNAATTDDSGDAIKFSISSYPDGKVINPGDTADFEAIVYWDKEYDSRQVMQRGEYDLTLEFENTATQVLGDDDEVVPDTGDTSSFPWVYVIVAGISGLVLIGCIILLVLSRKKNKK